MSQNKMPPDRYSQMIKHLTRKKIKNPFTPASAIQRSKKILEIEAFQDFNERNPVNKADGGRIGFKYGSIPEALKKLIEDGDTNFESMPALKNKIEEMTGKRPGGSFQKGQTNYGKLLEKFTFEKFKTKKKYKHEEYENKKKKKLKKKKEKLNKKNK